MATSRRARRSDRSGPPRASGDLREQLAAAGAPPEVLTALEGAHDIDDALDRLTAAGLLPSREQALAAMLEGWAPLLREDCGPLTAELAGYEYLATMRAAGAVHADLPDILASLIDSAEQVRTREALAMLRVFGAMGPVSVRPAAEAAAERLVGSGLDDPAWAGTVGRPTVRSCFGYADPFGSQEVLALAFGYGRRQHAIAVLIDYTLGGGVKDCYVAAKPRVVRNAYEDSAQGMGTAVYDYSASGAVDLLDRALAAQPCPVLPDQVDDVATYLDLLRARTELLRAGPPPTPVATRRTGPKVHRLKITLRGSTPPIWRRIEVPSDTSLLVLNEIVQATFGWLGYHMWVFTTRDGEFGEPDPELGHGDAAGKKLSTVAPRKGSRLRYTYDFGDDWEHEILVEDVSLAEPDVSYPRCLTGRRAAPPDDCGGIWGYQEVLEVLADPDHPEHAERLEVLGLVSADELDPARFDRAEVDARLSRRARGFGRFS